MQKRTILIIAISVLALIALDQYTKWLVVNNMEYLQSIEIIPNFFYLTSHRNSGMAWGLLDGAFTVFYIATAFALVVFYFFLKEVNLETKKVYSIAIILLIPGAIGNFIDRLFFKEVVDFLDFLIFGYDFPIFNVADMLLVIGTILLGYDILIGDVIRGRKNHREG